MFKKPTDPCKGHIRLYVPVDHNCGAWNPSMDVSRLTGTLSATLVADGYPEQIVTTGP